MIDMNSSSIIELGFIEETQLWKLNSKFFPSKVGGFPSWLELQSLPKEEDLQCKKCRKPLCFLCQIYAPVTSIESCFHRTVFVFICRDGSCSSPNDSSNIRVFRCQLPRKNKFYSFQPPDEEEKDSATPSASDFVKLCRVCGSFGPKVCGGCKLVSYCSRDHQGLDWKAGHKEECKDKEIKAPVSSAAKAFCFPEYEVDMEPEELESTKDKTDEELLAEYEDMLKKGQGGNLEETSGDSEEKDLLKMAAKETDKQFAKFRARIDSYPDQVIRYDRCGEPLFVSSENKPSKIPPCQNCGEKMEFEFQIMPQLLVHLKVDSPGQSIDWGTILVYTCSGCCSQDAKMYIEEIAFKQDYTPSTDFLKQ